MFHLKPIVENDGGKSGMADIFLANLPKVLQYEESTKLLRVRHVYLSMAGPVYQTVSVDLELNRIIFIHCSSVNFMLPLPVQKHTHFYWFMIFMR